ncbi:MAG: nuclear transport factor 2 family protein [Nevskia sp.]|nr:nuclear transport factor 2 family protein [Nevskia sp.]
MKKPMMMTLAGSLGILAGVCGCATLQGASDPAVTVRLKFAAFDRHDVSAIQGYYADDAILRSPDNPELAGNAPIADVYRHIFDAIPDARDEIRSFDQSADKVFVQFVMSGHFKGAADQPVKLRIMSIYTVRDGRIVEDSTYYDRKM